MMKFLKLSGVIIIGLFQSIVIFFYLTTVDYSTSVSIVISILSLVIEYYLYILFQAQLSNKWPFVNGVVLSSNIIYEQVNYEEGGFKHNIVYQYSVDDKVYTSNKIHFGMIFYDFSEKNAKVRRELKVKKNDNIKIYYNPKKAKDAVLITGVDPSTLIPIFFLVLIAIAVLMTN